MSQARESLALRRRQLVIRSTQVREQLGSESRGEMVLVIAGADAKRTVTEQPVGLEGEELPEWVHRYLDAAREGGMTLREAVKPLARHLEISASDLYRRAAER